MAETLGQRIRRLRLESHPSLTLGAVAENVLSVGLVSKVERDLVSPSLETLRHLAARLGVSPGALLDGGMVDEAALARGALDAARARLLLGDPAAAAAAAAHMATLLTAASGGRNGSAGQLRARLLALVAEARFGAGDPGLAAHAAAEAAALLPAQTTSATLSAPTGAGGRVPAPSWDLTRAEVAWALGLLERRRGRLEEAERTWTDGLACIEASGAAHPWWGYLRASLLYELGGLHEARGEVAVARDLVARAASIAAGVAQTTGPALALLAEWDRESAAPGEMAAYAAPAAACVLAVTAAAERMVRRLTQEAARLERIAASPPASRPPVAGVSHSRHLR
ncbi:MAG: hypothetical protein AVDCRST_MAG77-6003 [uncultured Chloroflexi bacterium]|uniref:HTH cro/C1-type domain-containing protein n=1 Tax=uncultured Chloroflexota bacterium TaxID=166587 RepID=A0A6J4KB37_9CHLR|nr:MAG: hypothetical protein AVDCRST_MAG77-6003 [uncultured Chloroflexota bacterium]